MPSYYCNVCHSITGQVIPVYYPDQEKKYLNMVSMHTKSPTTSPLALEYQFLLERSERWNYSMACPMCGGLYYYWLEAVSG